MHEHLLFLIKLSESKHIMQVFSALTLSIKILREPLRHGEGIICKGDAVIFISDDI